MLTQLPPCLTNPNQWLQPAETPWGNVPAAEWAARQCRTRCPRLADCARDALTAGAVEGLSRHAVAAGVVMGGVLCDGTPETETALASVAGTTACTTDTGACRDCQRRFVPAGTPGNRRGGGVVAAAGGRCRRCYTQARRTGTIRPTRYNRCGQCSRPMTTKSKPQAGHVIHGGRGLCQACHRAGLRAVQRDAA